jgi:hypothetical protein
MTTEQRQALAEFARWNFDATEACVTVCRNHHEKGDDCEYEPLHPAEALSIINKLRSKVLELQAAAISSTTEATTAPQAMVPLHSGELNTIANKYGFPRGQAQLMNMLREVERRCGVEGGRLYRHADGMPLDWEWTFGPKAATEATAEPAAVPVAHHQNVINALKKERDGWHEEATSLAKQLRIAQVDLDMRREHQAKDVWYWQGDGEDHVESMSNRMLVVIYASDLRAALAAQGAQKAEQQAIPQALADETLIVGWPDTDRKVVRAPDGVLIAIQRAGFTLLKTQYGYELRKLGPITAQVATPPKAEATQALCVCKDRAASACPGEWEPGCDLGSNPAHVRVHEATQAAPPGMSARVRLAIDAALEGGTSEVNDVLPDQWSNGYSTGLRTMATVVRAALTPPSPAQSPGPNACKLTECQGQPRCRYCLAMDTRHGTPRAAQSPEQP